MICNGILMGCKFWFGDPQLTAEQCSKLLLLDIDSGLYCWIVLGIITIDYRGNAILSQPVECHGIRWHFILEHGPNECPEIWKLVQMIPNLLLMLILLGYYSCWTSCFLWKKDVLMRVLQSKWCLPTFINIQWPFQEPQIGGTYHFHRPIFQA